MKDQHIRGLGPSPAPCSARGARVPCASIAAQGGGGGCREAQRRGGPERARPGSAGVNGMALGNPPQHPALAASHPQRSSGWPRPPFLCPPPPFPSSPAYSPPPLTATLPGRAGAPPRVTTNVPSTPGVPAPPAAGEGAGGGGGGAFNTPLRHPQTRYGGAGPAGWSPRCRGSILACQCCQCTPPPVEGGEVERGPLTRPSIAVERSHAGHAPLPPRMPVAL